MHAAVVHLQGSAVHVHFAASPAERPSAEEATGEVEVSKDPGPIVPELKELYWGGGSFIVFAILMRLVLFPRVKKGMEARYQGIRGAHESADAERSAARAEVADYEAKLAVIKAEAARTIDAARATLEAERTARLAEVNARIAERRAAAAADAERARAAVRAQVAAAVGDVAGTAGRLATGRTPSADVVTRVVNEVMAQ